MRPVNSAEDACPEKDSQGRANRGNMPAMFRKAASLQPRQPHSTRARRSSTTWAQLRRGASAAVLLAALTRVWSADPQVPDCGREDPPHYFQEEVAAIEEKCLAEIASARDWAERREVYRTQLREMLGLEPLPARSELRPVVTGQVAGDGFVVEKLHFQALPEVYVTANFYLPTNRTQPVPGILYVCGHARVVTNGVSCGNKTGYQHHGAWFARHGYACLMIDTVQLGEIEGLHHGTYRLQQWWWNSRGFTPAGIEAWFGIRALDYLCSRPEVDADRIGMTGRSGGGSYTWTVAALDDRVKVAAPVAGITDLRNQVVDGVVDGHCDCMFFVNTYRWDFAQLAALLAPRPLLIANSDKDTIFPLEGVVRLHDQVRRIYRLHGAADHLGLLITEGPHSDTQDLQVPVFRWFNRFLKGTDSPIASAAQKFADPSSLRVFETLPADQLNTRVQEWFGPGRPMTTAPGGSGDLAPENETEPAELPNTLKALREKVFGGWPDEPIQVKATLSAERALNEGHYRRYDFHTQPGIGLSLHLLYPSRPAGINRVLMTVLDAASWSDSPAQSLWQPTEPAALPTDIANELQSGRTAVAFFAPRTVAPSSSPTTAAGMTQLRRRYMLLGQTLDGMRVWDIRCAVRALRSLPNLETAAVTLRARKEMAINAGYAALFEPEVNRLEAEHLPQSHLEGPDYLNVLRVWDIDALHHALGKRMAVVE